MFVQTQHLYWPHLPHDKMRMTVWARNSTSSKIELSGQNETVVPVRPRGAGPVAAAATDLEGSAALYLQGGPSVLNSAAPIALAITG